METPAKIKAIHDLDNKEIAKEIRKDLKETFWKDFKFSVTSPNGSIEIGIIEWNIEFFTLEYREAKKINTYESWAEYKAKLDKRWLYRDYTEEWTSIMKEVTKIWDLYNHDNSDSMTDYFDVNYYLTVTVGKWDKDYICK